VLLKIFSNKLKALGLRADSLAF